MPNLKPLEAALNHYLALDPESAARLSDLEDKVIQIDLAALTFAFQMQVKDQRLLLALGNDLTPNVTIKGSPINLLALSLARDKKRRFLADDLSIDGDAELGQQMLELFQELQIDWEEHLSALIGDVASHQIGNAARKLFSFGKQIKETLFENTNAYLHEEKRLFPPAEEIDNFYKDVDELRLDLDRLEARIKNL